MSKRKRKPIVEELPGQYRMPFGKYRDKTLDQICSTDAGLLWLDWAVDAIESADVNARLTAYAMTDDVQAAIAEALDNKN